MPAVAAGRLSPAIGVVLVLAVLQQPVASLLRRSYSFLLSDFPMYSNVYFSTRAEVAAIQEAKFQPPPIIGFRVAGDTAQAAIEQRLREADRDDALPGIARKIAAGEPVSEADAASVRDITARYVAKFGAVPPSVDVLADTWRFDWSIADFTPRHQWKTLATVSLDEGTLTLEHP